MAENLVVKPLHEAFVILFEEILPRLAAADKIDTCNIVERFELRLYLRGGLLCGHILIDIGEDLILIADILDYLIDVYVEKRKAAHYYKAGNYYCN